MGGLITSLVTPITALIVEECVEIYHLYIIGEEAVRMQDPRHADGDKRPWTALLWTVTGMIVLLSRSIHGLCTSAGPKLGRLAAILRKELPTLFADCVLQFACVLIVETLVVNIYLLDVPGVLAGRGGPGVLPDDMLPFWMT